MSGLTCGKKSAALSLFDENLHILTWTQAGSDMKPSEIGSFILKLSVPRFWAV